jgi:CelD/BcsL family acetyltransferase involved in cellulose biosynthesis
VFSYNGSYRAELAKPSPGTVLTAEVIRAACERGKTEYDMLRGEEEYKRRWSDKYRAELQLVFTAGRPWARHYTFWALDVMARLKQSPWLRELDDRISGLLTRLRYRHGPPDGEGAPR